MSGNRVNRNMIDDLCGAYVEVERLATTAMKAGMNVIRLAGKLAVHPTAEDEFDEGLIVVGKKEGQTLDTEYAIDERTYARTVRVGDKVQVLLATGVTTAVDSELASAGDGTFKLPAVAGAGVLYKASEVVTGGASPLLCDAIRVK